MLTTSRAQLPPCSLRQPAPHLLPIIQSLATCHRPSSPPAPHPSNPPADDDNDLDLAHLVRRAYLPGITADTMRAAVEAAPTQFHVSGCQGVWGTEELLELLISEHLAAGAPDHCAFS